MTELTTRERFIRTLTGRDTDRVPFMKVFGGDNAALGVWLAKYPLLGHYIDELLGFEGGYRGWRTTMVNFWLCGVGPASVVSENERERYVRMGDGSLQHELKGGDYHHDTVEYAVKDKNDWDRIKSLYLDPLDSRRIPPDWAHYAEIYKNRDFPLQLTCGGVYGFLRSMMGDVALCYAIYDDPELVDAIITDYIDMCFKLWEILCRDVKFDLIECWEDMASKNGSIISEASFKRFLAPHYRRIRAFADANDIPVLLVDSDGNTDKLARWMNEAGVNALYPFEVGAGCDPFAVIPSLLTLGGIGGLEKNCCSMGKNAIDAEMEKARALIKMGRFIPGPDHFVLSNVEFEGYKYFMNRLREVVMTTKPGQ